ncbi:MAG: hypothetical protein KDE56_06740, partial [Anaerolineales bacterium]|nr:hypothetical protein [Anaerolineales bacterium]
IAQLRASQLTLSELQRLYDEVKPDNYHAPHISSIEWLVAALWEVPEGHVPLHTFMQRATGQPVERPDKPPQAEATQLIVMIEPGKQAEDSMLLSLWVNHNDRQDNLLPGVEIKLSQLDAEIGGELELWTAAFPDTQAIEFYLPKALLKLPVDDWEVGSGLEKQRLVKQYHISRGTLERHRARAILKQLRQLSHPEQRNVMLALRQKPLMLALMRHSGHWETRWQQLQRHERCHLQLLACPIDRQAIRTMDVLQTNVPASTCFALLTFTPGDLASEQLDDPLGLLLTTGLPLIAWARAGDGTTAFSQHLQAKVLDDHCNHIIRDGAADIVALIHQIQRQPLDEDTDPHHIGRQLSLVLDNPERDLPLELERIRM